MQSLVLFLIALSAFPFLFPEEFLYWSRRIRHPLEEWLKASYREALRQWERDNARIADVERELPEFRHRLVSMRRKLAKLRMRKGGDLTAEQRAYEKLAKQLTRLETRIKCAKKKRGAKPVDFAPDVSG